MRLKSFGIPEADQRYGKRHQYAELVALSRVRRTRRRARLKLQGLLREPAYIVQVIFSSIVWAPSISTVRSFSFSSRFITSLKRLKPMAFSSKSG